MRHCDRIPQWTASIIALRSRMTKILDPWKICIPRRSYRGIGNCLVESRQGQKLAWFSSVHILPVLDQPRCDAQRTISFLIFLSSLGTLAKWHNHRFTSMLRDLLLPRLFPGTWPIPVLILRHSSWKRMETVHLVHRHHAFKENQSAWSFPVLIK